MNSEDQKLREYFGALRAADTSRVPSFHRLVRMPVPMSDRQTSSFSLRAWMAIGAGAAAFAAFAFSFHGEQKNPETMALEEQCLAIANWNPTTDVLLASGGSMWNNSSVTDELIETGSKSSEDPTNQPNNNPTL